MKHFAYYVHVDSALLSKTKLCFSEQLPNIVHSTNLSTTVFRDGSTQVKRTEEDPNAFLFNCLNSFDATLYYIEGKKW